MLGVGVFYLFIFLLLVGSTSADISTHRALRAQEDSASNPLRLKLKAKAKKIFLGLPIEITVLFENRGRDPIDILNIGLLQFYPLVFEVREWPDQGFDDDQEGVVRFGGPKIHATTNYNEAYTTLLPKESMEQVYDLVYDAFWDEPRFQFEHPGRYRVTAYYTEYFGLNLTSSNSILINVLPSTRKLEGAGLRDGQLETRLERKLQSEQPGSSPTAAPTATTGPTKGDTLVPAPAPTVTITPSEVPTPAPTTRMPSSTPQELFSALPSMSPTGSPSDWPTPTPTTRIPSSIPSEFPSVMPSLSPTGSPSDAPTPTPTKGMPSPIPSEPPSNAPSSDCPSTIPTAKPTPKPTTNGCPSPIWSWDLTGLPKECCTSTFIQAVKLAEAIGKSKPGAKAYQKNIKNGKFEDIFKVGLNLKVLLDNKRPGEKSGTYKGNIDPTTINNVYYDKTTLKKLLMARKTDALVISVAIILLHETVHWCDFVHHEDKFKKEGEAQRFENDLFGGTVTTYNPFFSNKLFIQPKNKNLKREADLETEIKKWIQPSWWKDELTEQEYERGERPF